MNTTQAQQKAFDDAHVAPVDRLEIKECNMRLKTDIKPKDCTFQVVLDALALTSFYQAFLITAKFEDLPLEQDILCFIRDLGHTRDITYLTDVNVDYLHQPWRAFVTVINKCLSGKETGMDKIRLSRAQILWDFLFQMGGGGSKEARRTNKMSYLRFTKIIIDYFMSKDQSISRRKKMFWHTARDDTMFTSMRCIFRHKDTQVYGTILPKELTNQAMLESKSYQTYYDFASGEKAPKSKYIRKKTDLDTSPKKKPVQATKATKRSKTQFHSSHASGLGDGVDTQSRVPDEQQQKVSGTNEGAGVTPEVPDVPKYDSESEEESWTFSQDDKDAEEESDKNDDSEETESDNDENDLTHLNLSTYKAEDQEEEKADEEEVYSDQRVSTPPDYELTEEEEYKEDDDKNKEGGLEEEEEEDDMYRDLNINLERSVAEMTDAQANQDTKDTHVTLTIVPLVVQQQSSSDSSDLVLKFINPSPDTGIDSILNQDTQSDTLVNVPISVAAETPSFVTTIPQLPIPNIQPLQQTPTSTTTTTTNPTMTLPEIPNFASLFQFDQRVSALESKMSEFRLTSQFAEAVSSILGIFDTYLASKMKEAVDVVDSTMKAIIKEQVQAQVSKIMPKIEKYITESLGAEVLVISTNQPQTSYAVAASLGRDDQDKDEDPSVGSNRGSKRRRSGKEAESSKEPKNKESMSTSSLKSASKYQPKSSGKSAHAEEHDQKAADLEDQPHQENPSRPPTPDREWHKTKTVDNRPPQPWITQTAQAAGTQSSFNEFLATPIDFSAFIMHRLKIDNLTQEVLTGPTYDLIKGTCKSVVELEYHLEEVFKATNDRLDWYNPEGKPYPHDLSKPLPLILNEQGRQVIPLDHFINNDLEYLKGGSSSKKYTTSITKTNAADYGQVKWIEDKKFYGYASNMETSKDDYSRHMIIAVISLKIMKWFGYSHLEEIIVRRQDDQLYKFREGDFKRLRRQDIKDMLLLLVQDKLTNLNLEERDGTLNHVHTALNDIALGIEMEYLPKRKWSKQDRQRARVMINLKDRRLMRSLEMFVGGRPYGGDLRLLERTI
ncbi:hypothetical protein Tco_0698818 [Tanacetum coccineum]